ncbi:CC0125/CC1285 family lipoprotein [Rickettsiella massiliensis]|uniref:CC0125/CC1285 family lipoprotein n=1 Tax=Rickettsiella massiliensis TaxID=676517 RepID=UPI00029B3EC8|nr:hypothetical protein [Rickettsiella massiliensis]
MPKRNILFILSLLILTLTGCATAYQPYSLGSGYRDIALSENTYKVSFRGNAFTSNELVQNYLLRRCAELTVQKGYKYFVIVNENTEVSHETITTPTTVQTNSMGTFMGNGSVFSNSYSTINHGQTATLNKYKDIVVIKLLKNNKNDINALNADIVLSNFKHTN